MLDRRDTAVAFATSAPARSADPRRGILEALMRTVALRGYDRTTIDRVLCGAEVSAPVFDEHFEDKQDCLLAALDELIGEINAPSRRGQPTRHAGLSRLRSACRRCWPRSPAIPTARGLRSWSA
jgi:AcrR family transcriptional regulator